MTVVRPSNAFGEGQLPDRGQGFIANAMAAILRNEAVTVFGGDQIVRDYVHVADVADGIVAVLERGRPGRCYNIGSGTGRTTNEVLALISVLAQQAGMTTIVEQRPLRGFDVPVNVLDCARLQTDTGCAIRVGFTEGLERTWQWFVDGRTGLPRDAFWSVPSTRCSRRGARTSVLFVLGKSELDRNLAWRAEQGTGRAGTYPEWKIIGGISISCCAFTDRRYLRVESKPLFVIYNPDELPEPERVTDLWRDLAVRFGLPGLYLVAEHPSPDWNARAGGVVAPQLP